MNVDNVRSQMRKGMLEYCILLLLHREAAYASDIILKLKEAHLARGRMKLLDTIDSLLEKQFTQLLSLVGGEDVNLLQVIDVLAFGLDGKVSGRFVALKGQVINVSFLGHLLVQVGGRIHPVHHKVYLPR